MNWTGRDWACQLARESFQDAQHCACEVLESLADALSLSWVPHAEAGPACTCSGVYAKGGPSTVDKKITLATITDRSSNDKGMVHN